MIIKSVKAIILKRKKYLLQLRDNKKIFFFPIIGVFLAEDCTWVKNMRIVSEEKLRKKLI